jgi:hypothetical protein
VSFLKQKVFNNNAVSQQQAMFGLKQWQGLDDSFHDVYEGNIGLLSEENRF